jgi:hypothetical protein
MLMPSLVFFDAWLWTMSISTTIPRRCASSISALSSSGVPQRDDAAKKLVTW